MSHFRLWTTDLPSKASARIGACFISFTLLAALLVAASESPIVVVESNRVVADAGEAEHAASDATAVRTSTPDQVLGDSILAGSPRAVAAHEREGDRIVNDLALASVVTDKGLGTSRQPSAAAAVPVAAPATARLSSFAPTLLAEPTVWPTSTPVPPPPTTVPPAPTAAPTAVPAPPAPTAVPPVVAAAPVAVAPPVVVAPPPVVPTQVAVVPVAIPRSGPPGVINQIPGSAWRWLDAYGWTVDWRQGPGPGRVAEAQYATSTIVIWYDTRRSDTTWAGAFAHELGHAVSYVHFGNQQMTDWNSMRGLSSWRWVPGTANDFGVGEGDFAEAFMSYLLGHPVRSAGGALSQQHRAWIAANTPF